MIDGNLCPDANLFSDAWNIHWWRSPDEADTVDTGWERSFLNDPAAYLGQDNVDNSPYTEHHLNRVFSAFEDMIQNRLQYSA